VNNAVLTPMETDAEPVAVEVREAWRPIAPAGLVFPVAAVVGAIAVGAGATVEPVLGLAIVVVVALGTAVVRWPMFGAYVLVAVAPILPGIKRGFPIPGLRLSEVVVAGLATLLLAFGDRRRAIRWRAVDWASACYVVLTVALGVFNLLRLGQPVNAGGLGKLLGPLQYFMLFRVAVTYFTTPERRWRAMRLVLAVSVIPAVIGIAQQLDIGPTRSVITSIIDRGEVFEGWDYTRQARATSIFPHWHPFAGYLVVVTLLGVSMLLDGTKRIGRRAVVGALMVPAVVALCFTLTVASMFGAVTGTILVGYFHGKLRAALGWLALGLGLAALFAGSFLAQRYENQVGSEQGAAPEGVAFRIEVWETQFIPALSGRLTTGYGPELPPEITWRHTENIYLTLLFRGGVPLLGSFLGMLAAVGLRAQEERGSDDRSRSIPAKAVLGVTIVLLPMMMVFPYMTSTGLPHIYWTVAGIAFAGVAVERVKRDQPEAIERYAS
jgi:hypothetical protein